MAAAEPVPFLALWIASRDGKAEEVRQLLAEDVDIEERGGEHETSPLHEAAFQDHENVVRVLFEHGADASAKDDGESTPLHHVATAGLLPMLQLLLENGADVSAKNKKNRGATPLHLAASSSHTAVVLLLLEHGAEVSSKTDGGWTPLHAAALCSQDTVARVLLDEGADLQSKTHDGRTAEDIATAQSNTEVVAMLKAEAVRREAVRRAQCEAFAMGHQERLGAGSWVSDLDAGVVRMVLEQV